MATHEIVITRGDTANYTISATYIGGTPRPFVEGDKVCFTVRKSVYNGAVELEKELIKFTDKGKAELELTPEETKGLSYGVHKYDIQLKTADNEIFTIVKESPFLVTGEVTW